MAVRVWSGAVSRKRKCETAVVMLLKQGQTNWQNDGNILINEVN